MEKVEQKQKNGNYSVTFNPPCEKDREEKNVLSLFDALVMRELCVYNGRIRGRVVILMAAHLLLRFV